MRKMIAAAVAVGTLTAPATAAAVDLKPLSPYQASGFARQIAKDYCDADYACEYYSWSKPSGCVRASSLRVVCQVGKRKYSGRRCYRTIVVSQSDRRYFWRSFAWRCG